MLLTEMGYTCPLRLLSLSQMVAFHANSCPSSAFINANASALGLRLKGGYTAMRNNSGEEKLCSQQYPLVSLTQIIL